MFQRRKCAQGFGYAALYSQLCFMSRADLLNQPSAILCPAISSTAWHNAE